MDTHIDNTGLLSASHTGRLTNWQLFCYGFLSFPIAIAGFVLVTYIPTFYAIEMGLGLSLVGYVFVFGRLLDVITDPLIGYFSDQTQSRLGARRPWMIVGAPLFCLAAWLLFVPPDTATLPYLLLVSSCYFLFYTALDVPYSSVGLEISSRIHERSVLASTKAAFQVAGALFAALIPLIFVLNTQESLTLTSKIILITSFLALCLFLYFVPRKLIIGKPSKPTLERTLSTIWANRPYRYIIFTFLIVQTANALTAGLTVLFVTYIIKAPHLIGLFLGVVLVSSALFLPLWIRLSKRHSKKKAWQSSILICMASLATIPFLGEGDIIHAVIFSVLFGAACGCDAIMPTSMLADIVYKDELDGKGRFAGSYLAVKNSVSKLTFIAPMGLAFPILDAVGFNSNSSNTANTLSVLIFFYAVLPFFLRGIALMGVLKMPQTERLYA